MATEWDSVLQPSTVPPFRLLWGPHIVETKVRATRIEGGGRGGGWGGVFFTLGVWMNAGGLGGWRRGVGEVGSCTVAQQPGAVMDVDTDSGYKPNFNCDNLQ